MLAAETDVTKDDWQALLEDFLSDESDAETFKDQFIEAMKDARAEKARIPAVIEELHIRGRAVRPRRRRRAGFA